MIKKVDVVKVKMEQAGRQVNITQLKRKVHINFCLNVRHRKRLSTGLLSVGFQLISIANVTVNQQTNTVSSAATKSATTKPPKGGFFEFMITITPSLSNRER